MQQKREKAGMRADSALSPRYVHQHTATAMIFTETEDSSQIAPRILIIDSWFFPTYQKLVCDCTMMKALYCSLSVLATYRFARVHIHKMVMSE